MSRDWEAEITSFFDSVVRVSGLISKLSTKQEQGQMEGKRAVFVVHGIKRTFAFEVRGSQILPVAEGDIRQIDTYCVVKSPERFLTYCDQVFEEGDTTAFERALQRGDLDLRGRHRIHDRLLWRQAFARLAAAREAYSR